MPGKLYGCAGTRESSSLIAPELRARIQEWISLDPDETTRHELIELLRVADADLGTEPAGRVEAAAVELADRFAGPLQFGTAGLRAPLGAGPRRMNRRVVREAAAGLVRWLVGHVGAAPTVVIGWDARHGSAAFALDSAGVIAAAGGTALVLPEPLPTPVLAFAIRHLGADAGVMCTASHNPRTDNGYKVYLGDGAQIVPPVDAEIAALIALVAAGGEPVPIRPPDDPAIMRLDGAIVAAYEGHVAQAAAPAPGPLRIVHTAMHGVSGALAVRLLQAQGFGDVHPVLEQAVPDPAFPTLTFPNPEEPGALDLAYATARRVGADLVVANDPDGDRLGAAVPASPPTGDGAWRALTGNEIGALLAEHVLRHTDGADRLVVTTIVSSRLLPAIAAHHGVHHVDTLTGFKWVVRPAMAHPEWRFVFGFEESLGYSVDPYVRDKDGLSAALALAALVAELRADGRTVDDELERLSRRHGHHASETWSLRVEGPGADARLTAAMAACRAEPPRAIAGITVTEGRDLLPGGDLPPTDALLLTLEDRSRVVLRPSGTEPKLKVYLEVVVPVAAGPGGYPQAQAEGRARLTNLREHLAKALDLTGSPSAGRHPPDPRPDV